ncbi:hypothetical protein ACWC10_25215 [Streptomyces sp. NPDC001595]|uniref:hypothetical protein n=1 Tax=Streptomyces sp. NPDC001532 TaxID=3154520 RepID=UPI00332D90CF
MHWRVPRYRCPKRAPALPGPRLVDSTGVHLRRLRDGVISPGVGSRAHMFKHRRVRVMCVLLISWMALAAVERWAEQSPWPTAALKGLLWSCVVAGIWWFAEMTQARPLSSATGTRNGQAHSEQ